MPIFHSGQSRLLWHALFESGIRMNEVDENLREITLISPWITDLTSSRSGWSFSAITAALGESVGGLESLSDILISLVQKGYRVKVATLSTTGKWLRKKVDSKLDEEVRMMKKLSRNGVECFLGENIHMKYLSTPFCVLSGSLNLSFNGIHGRNQENTHLTFQNNRDYPAILQGIDRIIEQSRPYDEMGTGSLIDWQAPESDWFVEELGEDTEEFSSNGNVDVFEVEVDQEEFSNYVPIEIIDGSYMNNHDLRMKYIQSKFIQILQQIGRVVLLSIRNKVNDDRFGELETSIAPSLEGDDVMEILPSIRGIIQVVTSEEEQLMADGINVQILMEIIGRLRSISRTILLSENVDNQYFDLLRDIEFDLRTCVGSV
jgi:hypothetical protein